MILPKPQILSRPIPILVFRTTKVTRKQIKINFIPNPIQVRQKIKVKRKRAYN
jgi:hypothetical protein